MATKERFSSLDTHAFFRELTALGRAWFEKAYQLPGGRLLITFKASGEGKRDVVVEPGRFAALVTSPVERPPEPGPFASELRRLLGGAPLKEIVQPGGERYLELGFSRAMEETPRILVLELFHPGNVIVVKEGVIAAVASPRIWAHRAVKIGSPYARPPSRSDPLKLSVGEISGALASSTTNLVTSLATRLSMGGPLAEELLARCSRDGKALASEEPDATARDIHAVLTKMLAEIRDPPEGYLYRHAKTGVLLDVEPFRSVKWEWDPEVEMAVTPTFSEAAYRFFPLLTPPVLTPADTERARLGRLREKQARVVESLNAAAIQKRTSADAILAHFTEVEAQVVQAVREIPDRRELEVNAGGIPVKIDPMLSLRENAQTLYDGAKVLMTKLEGAKAAMGNTDGAMARGTPRMPKTGADPSRRTPRKRHFWFEKAPRWFLTSTGTVVVAGRDARTNDWVVKRNLKPGDIYMHADVHGAPSLVIKSPPEGEEREKVLREAAQVAVSYSKAWRAGHASADVFWVYPDQVTKAGGSGEFVGTGSWVIHGTKNVLKDLPLELAIGEVPWEGERLFMAAPPAAFTGRGGKVLWLISPGEERVRKEAERELSKDMGLSLETVQSLLPGGGVSIKRA
jgi:predicted ribosome quality control (RQC) complex YloA/Tae2 family protein